jgi:hypothetical protein
MEGRKNLNSLSSGNHFHASAATVMQVIVSLGTVNVHATEGGLVATTLPHVSLCVVLNLYSVEV